jgi:hypothetical protein
MKKKEEKKNTQDNQTLIIIQTNSTEKSIGKNKQNQN